MRKSVAVNEKGRRIGEDHHRAMLSDEQIDQIRSLREDHGLKYQQLAEMYSVPKATIQSICSYRTRAQTPFGWKELGDE